VLVAGEADVAHLARLLRRVQRLDHAALGEVALRIVPVDALVHLPQVEAVGLQALQRLVELLHRHVLAAAVRADLCHEEDLVAPRGPGSGPATASPAARTAPAPASPACRKSRRSGPAACSRASLMTVSSPRNGRPGHLGPAPASLNISSTSFCVGSSGKPCGS